MLSTLLEKAAKMLIMLITLWEKVVKTGDMLIMLITLLEKVAKTMEMFFFFEKKLLEQGKC